MKCTIQALTVWISAGVLLLAGCQGKPPAAAPKKSAAAEKSSADKSAKKAPSLDERTANPQSPSAEELRKLLREHVKRSGKTAAEPYIFCTAAWCKPCTELKASLGDPRMKDAFAGTYLITLDVDTWGEALKKLGFKYSAIPAFFEVDVEGLPTGRTIDGGAWEENIPANMAPPLKQFFKPNG